MIEKANVENIKSWLEAEYNKPSLGTYKRAKRKRVKR